MPNRSNMRQALTDPFRPPAEPINVYCLHCGSSYQSDKIIWKEGPDSPIPKGGWCCPVDGCDGAGYKYDIKPDEEGRFTRR